MAERVIFSKRSQLLGVGKNNWDLYGFRPKAVNIAIPHKIPSTDNIHEF
jgi:hypothetical protein